MWNREKQLYCGGIYYWPKKKMAEEVTTSNAGGGDNPSTTDNNAGGAASWAGENKDTEGKQGWTQWGDDKDKDDKSTVPSYRLREETEKRKAAETKLAAFEQKEKEEAEKKEKAKWNYEKVISDKEAEIATLKETTKALTDYEKIVAGGVESSLKEIEKEIWADPLKDILGMLGYESADTLGKYNLISKVRELSSKFKTTAPSWGSAAWAANPSNIDEAKKWWLGSYLGAVLWGKK